MLLENERGEWELPGGKLEAGEGLEGCLEREILEELNLRVEVGPLLDVWVYEVLEGAHVLVVTYGCLAEDFTGMKRSREHTAAELFCLDELEGLNLPRGYASAIRAWFHHSASRRPGG